MINKINLNNKGWFCKFILNLYTYFIDFNILMIEKVFIIIEDILTT